MEQQAARKPMKYYIDFENVHGPGLKGVDALSEDDHVLVFYSQAAETFHIEHAIDLLNSKAKIEFVEIDGGTRNSLDFQLVAALFGTMSDEYGYAIVSGDGGFDAAIKMGQRLELPEVVRLVNIQGDTELPAKPRTRRSRSSKAAAKEQPAATAPASEQETASQQEAAAVEEEVQEQAKPQRRPRRRGSRRSTAVKIEQAGEAQDEGQPLEGDAAMQPAEAQGAKPMEEKAAEAVDERPASPEGLAEQPRSDQAEPAEPTGETPAEAEDAANKGQAPAEASPDEGQAPAPQESEKTQATAQENEPAQGDSKPSNGNGGSRRRGSRGSGKSGKREDVAALLAKNGAEIDQHQLSTIMQALNGSKKLQDFYRRIIQLEKQEKGLPLYRKVRDYYKPLLEIVNR